MHDAKYKFRQRLHEQLSEKIMIVRKRLYPELKKVREESKRVKGGLHAVSKQVGLKLIIKALCLLECS